MDNRVGDHLPAEAEISKAIKQLDDIKSKLAAYCVTLTPDERRSRLKFRPGGEAVVNKVAKLAKKYEVDNDDTPVAGMLDDMTLAARIASLASDASTVAQMLDDTLLQAQSEAWQAATSLYSQLRERARNNATLHAEMEELVAFFATGKRAKKAAPPAK